MPGTLKSLEMPSENVLADEESFTIQLLNHLVDQQHCQSLRPFTCNIKTFFYTVTRSLIQNRAFVDTHVGRSGFCVALRAFAARI